MKKLLALFLVCVVVMGSTACTVGTKNSEKTKDKGIDKNASVDTNKESGTEGAIDGTPVPSLKGKKIGVAVIGTTNNFDRTAYQAMQDRIKELGGEVIATDGERDDQKHIAHLENMITESPDAVVKMLGDAKVYEPILKKISESEIPLFTVDHPSVYSMCNATSDNYTVGSSLARQIFEDMGGEGMVGVFNGFYGVRAPAIRYDMLRYVAKDYQNVTFLEPDLQDITPGTVEDAYKKTQDLLTRFPSGGELKAITATWDIPGIGAAQAIDAAGRSDIKVYGIDGDPTALEMVKEPKSSYQAIMCQNPKLIGMAIVDQVARYLEGQEVPSSVYVEPILVTKDNYESAIKELYGE